MPPYSVELRAMLKVLAVYVWCFQFTPLVYCTRETNDIENKIYAMKDKARTLEEENQELNQKLERRKLECEAALVKLKNETHLDQQLELDRLFISELSNNITMKKIEEQIVLNALDREYLNNNKYYLKLEMMNHELELSQLRRKNGVDERCRRFRPLIKKYELDLSIRSLPTELINKSSDKARLALLNSEYNEEKHIVKKLNDSNTLLNLQLENEAKICEIKKANLRGAYEVTSEQVMQVIVEKNLFEEELSVVTNHLQSLYAELEELRENNQLVKIKVLDLMVDLKEFDQDNECYKEMFSANIFYMSK